jgi:oxalate decarboxylase/phosphoglucose isomerase-like protein (cupin superfamily)
MYSSIAEISPYITKDGSEIRELIHPDTHKNFNISLAEATIHSGQSTQLHKHHNTEEIYLEIACKGRRDSV